MGEMCLVPPHGRAGAVPHRVLHASGAEADPAVMDSGIFSLDWNLAQADDSLAEGCRGIRSPRKVLSIHHPMLGQPLGVFLLHLGVAQVDTHWLACWRHCCSIAACPDAGVAAASRPAQLDPSAGEAAPGGWRKPCVLFISAWLGWRHSSGGSSSCTHS